MPNYLITGTNFANLSISDLLRARDMFHVHLMNKAHVVGTAIGLYRRRRDKVEKAEKKTLANTMVDDKSWPTLLVFVDDWGTPAQFGHGRPFKPDDYIPPQVFMPDGQIVPICVIQVDKQEVAPEQAINLTYPANLIGGGFPVLAEVQGVEHFASIGCIVSDGHTTYALTNRHVSGKEGEVLYSVLGGNKTRIGVGSSKQVTDLPFEKLYPGWQGSDLFVNLDIGLIEIDDRCNWTTQIYGIGKLGALADLSVNNFSLKLIGMPVRAFGCASREMQGEVCAFFYRYKAVGGFEYVADFIIGPRKGTGSLGTRPGDSGTVWVMDDGQLPPRPFALQWGGQVFLGDNKKDASSYALATCLSNVCTQLDVDVVRDWNIDQPDYWGAVGHYGIATNAIAAVRNSKLKQLMEANLERISFETADINKKAMQGLSKKEFVPLADVPDMVWKVGPFKRGGQTAPEHANHFADMDREISTPVAGGKTLLEICEDPNKVSVAIWQQYYDEVQKEFPEHESRGLLPFRAWQFYQGMVDFVKSGNVASFVCAAGIVSHYVGDACQPLHISYLFNGDPDKKVPGTVRDSSGKHEGMVPEATGVHSSYEDDMVDFNVRDIMDGVENKVAAAVRMATYQGGHAAAVAVVDLMQKTFQLLSPREILDAFLQTNGQTPKERAESLWTANNPTIGERTIEVMAQGCLHLAQLWDSAWEEGGGDSTISDLSTISEEDLETLYRDKDFMPSHTLDTIGSLLQNGTAAARARGARGTRGAGPARPSATPPAPAVSSPKRKPRRR